MPWIDIGKTKISGGLIEENGNCAYRIQMPNHAEDNESTFEQVVDCIKELLERSHLSSYELQGIGIGVFGNVDVERGIAVIQTTMPSEYFPLVDRIKEQFPAEYIIIDKDVHMAAYAEWAIRGKNLGDAVLIGTGHRVFNMKVLQRGEQ